LGFAFTEQHSGNKRTVRALFEKTQTVAFVVQGKFQLLTFHFSMRLSKKA